MMVKNVLAMFNIDYTKNNGIEYTSKSYIMKNTAYCCCCMTSSTVLIC